MEDSFAYTKDKRDKSHATPDYKVGDLVLVSTTNFDNINRCKKIKELFAGPFVIKALHGENVIEVELSEELSNKHPTFQVSLIKPYKSSDSEKFPFINKVPQNIPPVESPGTKKTTKVLKERKLRTKKVREYLLRHSDPACEDDVTGALGQKNKSGLALGYQGTHLEDSKRINLSKKDASTKMRCNKRNEKPNGQGDNQVSP
ncbi:hypothetical protein O181_078671 [Austropuccinia psidii MF-1]|uniref:Tf2-1-like SH3-like domain-containing protein n=1 Tax=Austropuccinia psidii MF-1 TaxID=1389203 RepID=A0A9Q3FKF4_9BASI|nr:hypothetical protein [Austropuccinia psidii MF-1]